MIAEIIKYTLQHLPMVLLCLAWLIGLTEVYGRSKSKSVIIGWLLVLPVGVAGIWGFVFHAFFPEMADQMIGWVYSPFEFEVAMANLAMGLVGLFGFRASLGYCRAATLFSAVLLWGAAVGHVYQMIVHHNFDPGNAGAIFWTDILIPVSLMIALKLRPIKQVD